METVKRTPHEPNATAYRRTGKNEHSYDHDERRGKVTLRDFRAARWLASQGGPVYTFGIGRRQYDYTPDGQGNCYTVKRWPRRHCNARRIAPKHPSPMAYLMSSPLDAERVQLRDQVRSNAKQLASKTAKYLTMNSEYIARRAFAKARTEKEPDLQTRLNSLSGSSPPSRPVNLAKWPSGLPITMGSGFTKLPPVRVRVVAGLVPFEPPCKARITPEHKVAWAASGRLGYLIEFIASADPGDDTSAERAELIALESNNRAAA